MKRSKKKRRSTNGNGEISDDKQGRILKNLLEAFATVSMEEAVAAYREAKGDPNIAAEILNKSVALEDQSNTSSSGTYDVGSSSSSCSYASDVFGDARSFVQDGFRQKSKSKTKRVIASAGTVSTVLGKDYVSSVPKKGPVKLKEFHEGSWSKEETEQFLVSMLGDDCELSLAVVSDVYCQCGYNLEKTLDVLLDLSASSKERSSGYCESTSGEDVQYLPESNDNLIVRKPGPNFRSSDIELQDNVWFTRNLLRDPSKISKSSKSHCTKATGHSESELPQVVLTSLFNLPTPKTAEAEPNNMNWRNVVKKITSLKPSDHELGQLIHDKEDEYQVLRESAKQHWDSMKSYYHKAATAFTNGEKEYASYLSEKGRSQSKMAREFDEKASQDIFSARNKNIENVITIDLHGQHIKPAMKLLKLHLLFGAYVRSVQSFRVITGCGSHGVGKSKLKTSVINLLQKESIPWSEENRGTLLIKLNGQTDFSFLNSGSDSD